MVIFMEQFIISISQEFGSLGHEIAEHLTRSEAIYMIRKKGWRRKEYHNTHCDYKRGDSRNYDLTVNSNKLNLDECVKLLIDYIDKRYKKIYEHMKNKME